VGGEGHGMARVVITDLLSFTDGLAVRDTSQFCRRDMVGAVAGRAVEAAAVAASMAMILRCLLCHHGGPSLCHQEFTHLVHLAACRVFICGDMFQHVLDIGGLTASVARS
jgi:hypothetical protein